MSTPDESLQSIGPTSLSTETSPPSTGLPFRESIFCAGDSPAKMLVGPLPTKELESQGVVQDYGQNMSRAFAHYDHDTSLWKTSQVCLTMDLAEFSETWPRAGTMRNGHVYQHAPLVPHIHATECGLWPTPTYSDGKNNGNPSRYSGGARDRSKQLNAIIGGRVHPNLCEWLMGFPVGFTE